MGQLMACIRDTWRPRNEHADLCSLISGHDRSLTFVRGRHFFPTCRKSGKTSKGYILSCLELDRTHAPVPEAITATEQVEWTWDYLEMNRSDLR
ncbi:hypothetical protein AVEN_208420-1 [Araneus ventricosus]|uniref:Uncharacterized protein n=1 Tax=Araneus ventricosus TaxID=182803 RepID=A0A4Y2EHC1_ARAVE|nr:hypothetical protein AVEN_208420-1 [Araneus ventricosus]